MKKKGVSETQSKQYPYLVWHRKGKPLYTNIKSSIYDSKKVIMQGLQGPSRAWYADKSNTSEDTTFVEVKNQKEGKNLLSILKSRLYRYIEFQYKIGHTYLALTSILPAIDFTRTWTDAELYKHFGLTQEEIDYIEEKVK